MRRAWSSLSMPHYQDFLWKKWGETKVPSKMLLQFLPANHLHMQEKSRPEVMDSNISIFLEDAVQNQED